MPGRQTTGIYIQMGVALLSYVAMWVEEFPHSGPLREIIPAAHLKRWGGHLSDALEAASVGGFPVNVASVPDVRYCRNEEMHRQTSARDPNRLHLLGRSAYYHGRHPADGVA